MKNQSHACHENRRGSIYLVVLVVVASVTTMVLVGTSLRRTTAEHYRANDDRSRARQGARSAAEGALTLLKDSDTFLAMGKAGKTFKATAGKSTLSVSAVDKDTGRAVSDATTTLLVTAAAETDEARSLVAFDVTVQPGFLALLKATGATSYWTLGEPKDSTKAADEIGSVDGVYYRPDYAGKEDFIDGGFAPDIGSVDEVIEIPHDSSFETGEGTILLWARFDKINDVDQQAVFSKETSAGGDFGVQMFTRNQRLRLNIDSTYDLSDRNYVYIIPDRDAADDQWYHIAYSFGSGGTAVYLDGVKVITDPFYTLGLSYKDLLAAETNTAPWYLGARADRSVLRHPIKGSLARFVFIPEQLSDQEIVELMEAQTNTGKSLAPVEGSFVRVVE